MQTPTRKPSSECSGHFCRLCKCAFKMKFGDIDDIKDRKIILVCGEIITIQTVASLFATSLLRYASQAFALQEDI